MLTTLQAEVTKVATFNGAGVDISAMTAPLSVFVTVDALTAGSTVIFEIQTSVDNFSSDIRVEKTFTYYGSLANTSPSTRVVHEYDMPGFRNGVTSAKARLILNYIDPSSSVSYSSYFQN